MVGTTAGRSERDVRPVIVAVVVTYNRAELLRECLVALASQTRPPDSVLVIDNASTDDTRELLADWMPGRLQAARAIRLNHNAGGAGGFAEGLRLALAGGADWVWMMDDDAEPHPGALAELAAVAIEPSNVYGSLAVNGLETAWPMTMVGPTPVVTCQVADIPAVAEVQMLPFLGFMVHRDLVERIGLPDAGFFIAADDMEYCVRAIKAGARIIAAGRSRIEHPKSRPYEIKIPGHSLTGLELPPWKRYYDTRNRLLIARRHYGVRFFTQTIPGSLVRMTGTLLKEPQKLAQLKAFWAGFIDGVLGRKGRRHEAWGIR